MRGILTDSDKDYLLSEDTDLDRIYENQKRYRIRQRIKSGIQDFELLVDHLTARDREQIFGVNISRGIHSMLVFLYLGMGDRLLTQLEFAIEEARAREGELVENVDIEVDITPTITVQEFEDRREKRGTQPALEQLNVVEVTALYDAGIISEEDYETWQE